MNSVQLELLKLDKEWYKVVKKTPRIPLYVCLGEKQELKLFEAYFNYQNSEQANTNDIFLNFQYNFINKESYGQEFVKDWMEICRKRKEIEADFTFWKEEDIDVHTSGMDQLMQVFDKIRERNIQSENQKIFILLSPPDLTPSNTSEFESWIAEWCKKQKQCDKIKIIVKDNIHQPFLKLPNPKEIFKMKIDMAGLMNNVAAQTNKDKGNTENNFQQQIVSANDLLNKGLYDHAFVSLEKAVKIAKEQNYIQGECTARFMMAGVCLALERTKDAEKQFDKIFQRVEKDTLFEAEMYMNYAGFLLSQSRTSKALEILRKAEGIGEKINNIFIRMECLRMIGQFSDSESIDCYEKVLELGGAMEPELRKSGTLSYTASLLVKKYGENSKKGKELNERMIEMIGDNWKNLSHEPALSENN